MADLTPRAVLLQALREEAGKLRNGAYYAKRGAINWVTFPFEKYGRAIAIMMDDADLFRKRQSGFKGGSISIEIFAAMPEVKDEDRVEIDDTLMDEIIEDAEGLVSYLETARVTVTTSDGTVPVAYKVDSDAASYLEAHDASMKVQGIVVQFSVTF